MDGNQLHYDRVKKKSGESTPVLQRRVWMDQLRINCGSNAKDPLRVNLVVREEAGGAVRTARGVVSGSSRLRILSQETKANFILGSEWLRIVDTRYQLMTGTNRVRT